MDYFKDNFYKILLDRENFYMMQYYSNFHKKEIYIAIKELRDGIYCVLVSSEENADIDNLESFEYLKSLGKPFSLNMIILSNGEYNHTSNSTIANKLIINKANNKVIQCDNSCIPLRQIFERMFEDEIKSRNSKEKFLKYKKVTFCIIAVNIIMFIITQIVIDNMSNAEIKNLINPTSKQINQITDQINNLVLIKFGAKYNIFIEQGQIWRLLTCAFLHSGLIHIACNMYSLYIIGPQIEQIYGKIKYLIIYIVSCITASLMSFLMSPNSISVGASGGIFGLMGALLAFTVIERNRIQKKYMSSLIQIIVLNLFIGLSIKNIDNFAHIGGLVGGMTIGYVGYQIFNKKMGKI